VGAVGPPLHPHALCSGAALGGAGRGGDNAYRALTIATPHWRRAASSSGAPSAAHAAAYWVAVHAVPQARRPNARTETTHRRLPLGATFPQLLPTGAGGIKRSQP
jgi:hypothetical protein